MVNDMNTAYIFWGVWFLVGFICAIGSYRSDDGSTRTIDDWFAYCVITLGGFMSLGAVIALNVVGFCCNLHVKRKI